MPPDTAENNSIMRTNENIDFQNLDAQTVIRGCAKLAIQFDVEMAKHGDRLKGKNIRIMPKLNGILKLGTF